MDRHKKQVQTGALDSMAEEPKDLPQGESMAASDRTTDSPHESELQDTVSTEGKKRRWLLQRAIANLWSPKTKPSGKTPLMQAP